MAVYEACIDALAHMTLEGNADKYRLSLGGVAAPKERKPGRNVRKDEKYQMHWNIFLKTASGGDGDRDSAPIMILPEQWACEQLKRAL